MRFSTRHQTSPTFDARLKFRYLSQSLKKKLVGSKAKCMLPSCQVRFRMAYVFSQMDERMVVFFNGLFGRGQRKRDTHRRAYIFLRHTKHIRWAVLILEEKCSDELMYLHERLMYQGRFRGMVQFGTPECARSLCN